MANYFASEQEAISKLTAYFKSQVGYLEKASNSKLEDFKANAGDKNYTKYGAYFGHNGPDAYWCDYFVDYGFCQVFGKDLGTQLLGGLSGYTPTSASYFKKNGQWYTKDTKEGDQIFFKNSERINHTGYVYKTTATKVYTIEGNTSSDATTLERNGGCVAYKEYLKTNSRIAGYGRPNYKLAVRKIAVDNAPAPIVEGWQKAADGVRWWWQKRDGTYPADKMCVINKHKYLFDENGYMLVGWQNFDPVKNTRNTDKWCFFENTPGADYEGAMYHESATKDGTLEIWAVNEPNKI